MYNVDFLLQLKEYLYSKTGKVYFNNIRDGKEDILCTCPIHKGGQERHPSCGFSKIDKENISAGWFHCFNCGFIGNTYMVLKELLGEKFDKEEANKVLGIEDFEEDYRLNNNPIIFTIPPKEPVKYVSRKELEQYRYYSDYLKYRNISMNTANKFDIGMDIRTNEITFPIRDYTGRALAVGRRSIAGKRYEYPLGFTKPLYGVYELPVIMKNQYVWVVEGPFNLWSLYEYKEIGVALLGTGTQRQLEQLLTLDCKGFMLALDGDKAGRRGITKIAKFLQRHGREVRVYCVPDNEDINSMPSNLFPQMAIMTFREWNKMIARRFKDEDNSGNKDIQPELEDMN